MSKRLEWGGVVCDGERSQTAVHSWFRAVVPEDWGLPIAAQIQEDIRTGREVAMRALYRTPDGHLKEVLRRRGARTTTLTIKVATPGFLKDRSVSRRLSLHTEQAA